MVGVANTLRTAITDSAPGSGRPSVTTYLVINQGCHAATRHQLEADLLLGDRMHASCGSRRILRPVLLEKQTGENRNAYALMSGAGVLQYVLPCTRLECLSPYAHGAGLDGK